jgi:hypothetical protein
MTSCNPAVLGGGYSSCQSITQLAGEGDLSQPQSAQGDDLSKRHNLPLTQARRLTHRRVFLCVIRLTVEFPTFRY